MGLFKVIKNSKTFYIQYHITDNKTSLSSLDSEDYCMYIKVSCDTPCIKKWAQNLNQNPEIYMSHLNCALNEQSKNEEFIETGSKGHSKQNLFELDEERNLIWKQWFKDKNIYGRKGKFQLENKQRKEGFETIMNSIMYELNNQEEKITCLKSENDMLQRDNEELRHIAEKTLTMKENFEKKIYEKFSILLNAKKAKRPNYQNLSEKTSPGDEEIPSSVTEEKDDSSYGDEFDADTDVDEMEVVECGSSSTTHVIQKEQSVSSQDSLDLLSTSLDDDFKSIYDPRSRTHKS